jgi:CheY-like chemotaxis protein
LTLSSKPTILCVDDQAGNLRIRAMMLELFGFIALTATDHRSALQAASQTTVDLVVIDYHLAQGETGEEIARDLRVMFPKIPLIMLTGDYKLPQRAVESVDAVLIKGMSDPRALVDLIQKLLSSARRPLAPSAPAAPSKVRSSISNQRHKAS